MTNVEFKKLRHLAGLTQEQTARVLDVTHRTVIRWEHGEHRIRKLQAQSIRTRLLGYLFNSKRTGDES